MLTQVYISEKQTTVNVRTPGLLQYNSALKEYTVCTQFTLQPVT